jgi:hypothetical protein
MKYICCDRCYEECKKIKESIRSYERLSVSMKEDDTELTIQCNRHQLVVAKIGVGGYLQLVSPGVLGQKTFHSKSVDS